MKPFIIHHSSFILSPRPLFAICHLLLAILSPRAALAQSPKLLPFQGRLTDQNGLAVSNGVRLVQFKIYDVPTGGSPVWAGELHRTTVNGGLVNVMLGSKTPLSGVDFDKQLYLEITVDVSGPTGTPDNAITAADPPMLPRQAILPAVFAKEAADSRLLDGHDWSDLLVGGATNPASGTIRGDKIQLQGITASQIFPQTITAAQITSNTITSGQIADSTITAAKVSAQLVMDALVPPGSIIAFGGSSTSVPDGWKLCDGTALSSAQYPRLYAVISTNWGIGLTWSGTVWVQGTNNFNLPDLRGLLLRGVNGARTNFTQLSTNYVDPDVLLRTNGLAGGNSGNAVGSLQLDGLVPHTHSAGSMCALMSYDTHYLRLVAVNTPTYQYNYAAGADGLAESRPISGGVAIAGYSGLPSTNGAGLNPTGTSAEIRPKNAYVNYIIKY